MGTQPTLLYIQGTHHDYRGRGYGPGGRQACGQHTPREGSDGRGRHLWFTKLAQKGDNSKQMVFFLIFSRLGQPSAYAHLRRRLLSTTLTLLMAMRALAHMGVIWKSVTA